MEAYAAQIALMVADIFPYFEWPSSLVHRGGAAGRAAARDTPSTIQVQKETGGKCEREIAAPKYQPNIYSSFARGSGQSVNGFIPIAVSTEDETPAFGLSWIMLKISA